MTVPFVPGTVFLALVSGRVSRFLGPPRAEQFSYWYSRLESARTPVNRFDAVLVSACCPRPGGTTEAPPLDSQRFSRRYATKASRRISDPAYVAWRQEADADGRVGRSLPTRNSCQNEWRAQFVAQCRRSVVSERKREFAGAVRPHLLRQRALCVELGGNVVLSSGAEFLGFVAVHRHR